MTLYEFGPFRLDAERLTLMEGGRLLPLGRKVIRTLLVLLERAGEIVLKKELFDRVWPDGYVADANLTQNIHILRKALRHWDGQVIRTVPRVGYRFSASVSRYDGVEGRVNYSYVNQSARRGAWWKIATGVAFALLAAATTLTSSFLAVHSSSDLSEDGARMYAIGQYYWNTRSPAGVAKSIEYFKRVVNADPRNGRGYASLASANLTMGVYHYGRLPAQTYYARARVYAAKALSVDANNSQAYAVLGRISLIAAHSEQEVVASLQYFEEAIAHDPTNAAAHEWYGAALVSIGRFDEADGQLREALRLDPLSVATTSYLGQEAYLQRRYDGAIAYALEALDLSPGRQSEYRTIGISYEEKRDYARAIASFEHMATACLACRGEAAALLTEVYAHTNQMARARAQLSLAKARPEDVCHADMLIAMVSVGERRGMSLWLRRMRDQFVGADVSSDPRFAVVLPALGASRKQGVFHRGG